MKTYTIAPIPRITFAGITSAYLVILGSLWLFIEPLGTFGLIPPIEKLTGFYLYSLLLVIPAFVIAVFFRWYHWFKIHDMPFVNISIRSAIDGVTYSLRVAQNMQVAEFLDQYVRLLRSGPAKNSVETLLSRHYPVLQVKRDNVFIDIDSRVTFYTAKIKDGEQCQVRAEEHKHMNQPMFSRRSACDDD